MTIQLLLRPSSSSSPCHCSSSASSQVRGGRWRWATLWLLLLATAFWCTTHWAAAVDTGGGGIGGGIDEAGNLPGPASRRILRATPRSTIEKTLDQYCPKDDQCTDEADYAGVTLYWDLLFGTFCWGMPCVTSAFFISILQVIGFKCGNCLDVMSVQV